MFETFRYETERSLRGTVIFAIGVGIFALFAVALFPSIETSGVNVDEILEVYPEAMQHALGIQSLATVEGFLAAELYNFVWVLLLGLYFAYRSAGQIAGDIEHDRMDLLLSFPVSRTRLLYEKYASVLVPILVLNVTTALVVYGGVLAIGESIDPVNLVVVHLLSIPYLLACAAVGVVLSVLVDRADIAQRLALGVVFVLYLVESIAAGTDGFEWLQYVSPTHYYNPTPVLLEGTYDLPEAGVLLLGTVVLLGVAQVLFERRDI